MLLPPSAGLWGHGRSRSQACWLAAPLPSGPPRSLASLSTVLAKSSARAVTALLTMMPGVGRSLYKALSQACLSALSPAPHPLRPPRPAPRRYTMASCQPLLPRMSSRPRDSVPSGGQGLGGRSCVFVGKPERRAAQPGVGHRWGTVGATSVVQPARFYLLETGARSHLWKSRSIKYGIPCGFGFRSVPGTGQPHVARSLPPRTGKEGSQGPSTAGFTAVYSHPKP